MDTLMLLSWVPESRQQISYVKHNNTLVTKDREFGVKNPVKTYLVTSLLIDYSKLKFCLDSLLIKDPKFLCLINCKYIFFSFKKV